MRVSITTRYECGYEKVLYFLNAVEAAKYGEAQAKSPAPDVVSILLKGPEGEREFIS